jgi:hypothetical protein
MMHHLMNHSDRHTPLARAIPTWSQIQHRHRFEEARPLFRITITVSQNTSTGIVPPEGLFVYVGLHPESFQLIKVYIN